MIKALLLFFCICVLADCNTSLASDQIRKTDTYGNGVMYRTAVGYYPVLSLAGTWQEMGRQYGYLARKDLQAFYASIHSDLIARGADTKIQLKTAKITYEIYSQDMKDLITGMSETSGLSLDQHIVLDASFYLLAMATLDGHPPAACSGIAIMGPRTKSGDVIFGRNWDISRKVMLRYMKYLSLVVFNPNHGNSFVNIRPLGQVYVETGINEKGIFIELNNGEASDGGNYEKRRFSSEVIFDVLHRAGTLNEAVKKLRSIPAETAYIIQVADAKTAVSIERATFDSRVLFPEKGLLVAVNNFVEPYPQSWQKKLTPPPPVTQDPRRQNLLRLFNNNEWKNNLTAGDMLKLMDIEVDKGGAVHNGTVIQVVAVPQSSTVYFRGYAYSDWAKVDLKPLFRR